MNHKLKHGLHAAIVTSPGPGHGGSLFAWETYMAATLSGIPAILATFDEHRPYPEIGKDLRRLPILDGCMTTLHHLRLIAQEARNENKLLIIDTKSGFHRTDPMFEIIEHAGIREATSLAALMPTLHGARYPLEAFEKDGFMFSRGLVRNWGFRASKSEHQPFSAFPLEYWSPTFLTKEVLEIIMSSSKSVDNNKPDEEIDQYSYDPNSNDPRDRYITYMAAARVAIYRALLEPITEPVRNRG